TLAYRDASGLFPDCQRVESLGKRSWKGDSRRLNGNAAPGCVETYSSEFLRGRGRWRARVDECRAQQCIGAMYRMPIRLLGRERSGTEHELAPSFARRSALRAVTPPFPTRASVPLKRTRLQQTSELLLRSLCFRALMYLRALQLAESLEQ